MSAGRLLRPPALHPQPHRYLQQQYQQPQRPAEAEVSVVATFTRIVDTISDSRPRYMTWLALACVALHCTLSVISALQLP